ncbi:hypothetical protein GN244_ATG17939 [Phytophthora infestans]|uniref:Uncharacterized protein n=1 Tax=Phytophthora infestans TaxID=4787 RepID=A0A833SIF6_PHYIN|nr:hypothetical protein GN244_ATG17939 [Phytophthora infestans]KAF4140383.1 hypothetical protein GN958_ATG10380 [Phytophthora infestans]
MMDSIKSESGGDLAGALEPVGCSTRRSEDPPGYAKFFSTRSLRLEVGFLTGQLQGASGVRGRVNQFAAWCTLQTNEQHSEAGWLRLLNFSWMAAAAAAESEANRELSSPVSRRTWHDSVCGAQASVSPCRSTRGRWFESGVKRAFERDLSAEVFSVADCEQVGQNTPA